jgi:hypothetical protein
MAFNTQALPLQSSFVTIRLTNSILACRQARRHPRALICPLDGWHRSGFMNPSAAGKWNSGQCVLLRSQPAQPRRPSSRAGRLENNLGANLCVRKGWKIILEPIFAPSRAGKLSWRQCLRPERPENYFLTALCAKMPICPSSDPPARLTMAGIRFDLLASPKKPALVFPPNDQ